MIKYPNPAVAAVGDVVVIRELDNNFNDVEFVKAGAAFPKVMKGNRLAFSIGGFD